MFVEKSFLGDTIRFLLSFNTTHFKSNIEVRMFNCKNQLALNYLKSFLVTLCCVYVLVVLFHFPYKMLYAF